MAEDLDAAQRTAALQVLAEEVLEELSCVDAQATIFKDSAAMDLDAGREVADEEENTRTAERLAHGWPSSSHDPTLPRDPGRFEKSFRWSSLLALALCTVRRVDRTRRGSTFSTCCACFRGAW